MYNKNCRVRERGLILEHMDRKNMDTESHPTLQEKKKKQKKKMTKQKKPKRSPEENESQDAVKEPESLDKASQPVFPPTFSVSEIKNKQRRHIMFMKFKQEKRKVRVRFITSSPVWCSFFRFPQYVIYAGVLKKCQQIIKLAPCWFIKNIFVSPFIGSVVNIV